MSSLGSKKGVRGFVFVAAALLGASTSVAQLPVKKAIQNTKKEAEKAAPAATGAVKTAASSAPTSSFSTSPTAPKLNRSLADLKKIGIEKPPAKKWGTKGARKSVGKLLAPAKRKLSPKVWQKDPERAAARAKWYADAETKASPNVAKKLKELRAKITAKKLSYQVGATSVSEKPVKEITGLVEPDKKSVDEQRKKQSPPKKTSNLVQATRIERATPPPAAPKKTARREPDDVSPMQGNDIIATPEDARGSGGGWFPSSAMPSPTNPQFSWRDNITPVGCGSPTIRTSPRKRSQCGFGAARRST